MNARETQLAMHADGIVLPPLSDDALRALDRFMDACWQRNGADEALRAVVHAMRAEVAAVVAAVTEPSAAEPEQTPGAHATAYRVLSQAALALVAPGSYSAQGLADALRASFTNARGVRDASLERARLAEEQRDGFKRQAEVALRERQVSVDSMLAAHAALDTYGALSGEPTLPLAERVVSLANALDAQTKAAQAETRRVREQLRREAAERNEVAGQVVKLAAELAREREVRREAEQGALLLAKRADELKAEVEHARAGGPAAKREWNELRETIDKLKAENERLNLARTNPAVPSYTLAPSEVADIELSERCAMPADCAVGVQVHAGDRVLVRRLAVGLRERTLIDVQHVPPPKPFTLTVRDDDEF